MEHKHMLSCKNMFYMAMVLLIAIALLHGFKTPGHAYQTIMFYGQEFTFSDFYQSLADAALRRPYE